jgi:predicted GIY-YIG superfamily endonuclease
MVTIYELKLESGKYYVGKTEQEEPNDRILKHFSDGGASAWTRKYKPIEIINTYPGCDHFDEDKYTKKLMKTHGIDNVRGGTYVTINLDSNQRTLLEKEIRGADNKCFQCGGPHFVKYCPNKYKKLSKKPKCNKCCRTSHTEDNCYAKTDIGGNCLISSDDESESELDIKTINTDEDFTRYGQIVFGNPSSNTFCRRCGRDGHLIDECMAKKHVNGITIGSLDCVCERCWRKGHNSLVCRFNTDINNIALEMSYIRTAWSIIGYLLQD